jgi:hypothetical protein
VLEAEYTQTGESGDPLRLYRECLITGIKCPHCGERMAQSPWSVKLQ